MTTTSPVPIQHEPQLLGQTVVLVGGSAGIGLETARLARREGAEVVLVGRDPERLKRAALDVLSDTIQPFPSFSGIYDAAVMTLRMEIMDRPRPVRPIDAQMSVMSA